MSDIGWMLAGFAAGFGSGLFVAWRVACAVVDFFIGSYLPDETPEATNVGPPGSPPT